MKAAILTDLTRCIGCGGCALACQEINGLPFKDQPGKLSDTVWTFIQTVKGVHIKRQCMHCLDPTCVSVCPVTALQKTPEGPVVYEESRCIGCRYCMLACPFGIPKYEWSSQLPKVRKCILCYEQRVQKGRDPACTTACPTGATKFGDRDLLIQEAQARIAANRSRYVDRIYGLKEAGGTSVLFLSPIPFEELGFVTHVQQEPYPGLTWEVLSKIPNIVSVGGVLLMGVYWVINRRMTLEESRGRSAKKNPSPGTGTSKSVEKEDES